MTQHSSLNNTNTEDNFKNTNAEDSLKNTNAEDSLKNTKEYINGNLCDMWGFYEGAVQESMFFVVLLQELFAEVCRWCGSVFTI